MQYAVYVLAAWCAFVLALLLVGRALYKYRAKAIAEIRKLLALLKEIEDGQRVNKYGSTKVTVR